MIVPGVVRGRVLEDLDLPRDRVDLDRDHVGDEPVRVRGVDAVVVGRRRRARDVEDLGRLDPGAHPLRQPVRVPVRDARDPAQRDRTVGRALHAHLRRRRARGRRRVASSRVAPISRICRLTTPAERCAAPGRDPREPRRVRARRDRPDRRVAVELVHRRDVVGREPELVGDDLRDRGLVTLALRRRAHRDDDLAARVHAHLRPVGRARLRVVARAPAAPRAAARP